MWTSDGGDNWQPVKTTPGQDNLYDIGLAGNKLWAVGMNGALAASDDGLNWHVGVKNILTYQWLMDMVPTEKGGLVIGGAQGTIMISSNGGESWHLSRQMRSSASGNP